MPQVSLLEAIAGVRSGDRLVSFPTDTVPALAARLDRAELLFAAKQRRLDKPLILMAADVDDLWQYVTGGAAELRQWQAIAQRYLPGALTLVLPASDRVPPTLNPTNPTTIGVRVPNHAIARAILSQTGALATTSANLSGQPALQTMAEIEAQFPQVLTLTTTDPDLPLELTESAIGIPSTVMQWTGNGWQTLRQGAVVLEN